MGAAFRRLLAVPAIGGLVLAGPASPGGARVPPLLGSDQAATAYVDVRDSYYSPEVVTIDVGSEVVWTHQGSLRHSVTSDDGTFDSNLGCSSTASDLCMAGGEQFRLAFERLGTFLYYCRVHGGPGGQGMSGQVRVIDPVTADTSVTSVSAGLTANAVKVGGKASFRGENPGKVWTDTPADVPVGALDLRSGTMSRPSPSASYVLMRIQLAELPPGRSPPEAVAYSWAFRAGGKVYRMLAKATNLASATLADDPAGHARTPAIQLQTECQELGPVVACKHVAWLNGDIDAYNGRILARLPIGSNGVTPGSKLTSASLGGAEARASLQAGGDAYSDTALGADTYTVAEPTVELGMARDGIPVGQVNFDHAATVSGESFDGSLPRPGGGVWRVWARACFGTNCGIGSVKVVVP